MNKLVILFMTLFLISCNASIVKLGDEVKITYVGTYTNGTIFDTNDPKLQSQFSAPIEHFKFLTVKTGSGQVISGFEDALLGMKQGETKTVKIKAKDAYGTYDSEKTVSVPKHLTFAKQLNVQRFLVTSKQELLKKLRTTNISLGQIFETENFNYNITAINTTHVTIYLLNATRNPVDFEGAIWNSTFKSKNATTFVYEHNVVTGAKLNTPSGPYLATVNATHIMLDSIFAVGQQFETPQGVVRVSRESGDTYTLDFNHPLAGNDLIFTITVEEIVPKAENI